MSCRDRPARPSSPRNIGDLAGVVVPLVPGRAAMLIAPPPWDGVAVLVIGGIMLAWAYWRGMLS